MVPHQCEKEEKFEGIAGSLAEIKERLKTLQKDTDTLFTFNRNMMETITNLRVKSAEETTALKVRYSLLGSFIILIGAAVGYFLKGR